MFKPRANKAPDAVVDPRETLDYFYQRQLDELTKRRRLVKDLRTTRERAELEVQRLDEQRKQLEEDSRKAETYGREDVVNETAARLAVLERSMRALRRQYTRALEQESQADRETAEFGDRLQSFRTYKEMLKADFNLAAQQTAGSVSSSITDQSDSVDDDSAARKGQLLDLLSPDLIYRRIA